MLSNVELIYLNEESLSLEWHRNLMYHFCICMCVSINLFWIWIWIPEPFLMLHPCNITTGWWAVHLMYWWQYMETTCLWHPSYLALFPQALQLKNKISPHIPETCILEFLREAGFFYLIWCNLLTSTSPQTCKMWPDLSNYLENESNSETHLLL